jgi:hypothetical protein
MTIARMAPFRSKGTVKPQAFPVGSRAHFDETKALMISQFGLNEPEHIQSWEEWDQKYIPKTDDATAYINE